MQRACGNITSRYLSSTRVLGKVVCDKGGKSRMEPYHAGRTLQPERMLICKICIYSYVEASFAVIADCIFIVLGNMGVTVYKHWLPFGGADKRKKQFLYSTV